MPGHSVPALLAYPELNCPLKGGRVWQYCIGNEKSFDFLGDVLTEVCDLFPSKYIHIGGDECPKDRWHQCPLCQARIKAEGLKDEHELQSYFVKRIERFLNAKGRRLIGWDEILEGGLAPGAAVMSWRGMGGGIAAARSGHDVVMAPTSHVYFDYPQTTVEKVFSFEPVPKELNKGQAVHVMGAEAEMWSDNHPSEAEIEALVYPRACALAEVVWSPASARNEVEFMERLSFHQQRLAALGLRYRPLAAKAKR
jgi:hexosaminidase